MNTIYFNGCNVLTTQQLAELLDTNSKSLTRNFQRNKENFVDREHFLRLDGSTLQEFKQNLGNPEYLKYSSTLILWTLSGAKLIAKSCRTEKAREAILAKLEEIY